MAEPIKETIFNTGANDSLKAVDVYGDHAIEDSATPTELGGGGLGADAGTPDSGDVSADGEAAETPPSELSPAAAAAAATPPAKSPREAKAPEKDKVTPKAKSPAEALAKTTPKSTAAAVVGTGASSKQIAGKLETPLPPSVDAIEFLKSMPNESMGRINNALKAAKDKLGTGEYQELINADLSSITGAILGVLDKMGLNGILCPGNALSGPHIDDALTWGKWEIDIRKYFGCKNGKPEVDLGLVAGVNHPKITRGVMGSAAKYGAYDVLKDIMVDSGNDQPPSVRDSLAKSTLKNFKNDPEKPNKNKPQAASEYNDSLATVKPGWNEYDRNGEKVSDLSAYNGASDDSLDTLSYDERTDVDAIIAKDISTERKSSDELAREKYPNMQAA